MMNPHGTVDHVFADVADRMSEGALLLGVKNTRAISRAFVRRLEENGMLLHTLDRKALGGRAVDAALVNPLTLRAMTGSSSGTALNVLYHINDQAPPSTCCTTSTILDWGRTEGAPCSLLRRA